VVEPYCEVTIGCNPKVVKGGGNFSAGERQALALARAVLHARRVVAMDEPTANIDSRTDALLQTMLRRMFRGRTLLCIAHRLQTVIEMDRVAVLAAGEVVEFAPAAALLDGRSSQLAAMVRAGRRCRRTSGRANERCRRAVSAAMKCSSLRAGASRRW
jgi:ABC-type multidrug transport system fused ATPase/permease subunit